MRPPRKLFAFPAGKAVGLVALLALLLGGEYILLRERRFPAPPTAALNQLLSTTQYCLFSVSANARNGLRLREITLPGMPLADPQYVKPAQAALEKATADIIRRESKLKRIVVLNPAYLDVPIDQIQPTDIVFIGIDLSGDVPYQRSLTWSGVVPRPTQVQSHAR